MVQELEDRFHPEDAIIEGEDEVSPDVSLFYSQLNVKIAESDYNYRNRLISLNERLDNEFDNHLKKGDFSFHLEKFQVIDLGSKNVFCASARFTANSKRSTPRS